MRRVARVLIAPNAKKRFRKSLEKLDDRTRDKLASARDLVMERTWEESVQVRAAFDLGDDLVGLRIHGTTQYRVLGFQVRGQGSDEMVIYLSGIITREDWSKPGKRDAWEARAKADRDHWRRKHE